MKFTALALLALGFLMIGVSYRLFLGQGDKVVWAVWSFFVGGAITVVAILWLLVIGFTAI